MSTRVSILYRESSSNGLGYHLYEEMAESDREENVHLSVDNEGEVRVPRALLLHIARHFAQDVPKDEHGRVLLHVGDPEAQELLERQDQRITMLAAEVARRRSREEPCRNCGWKPGSPIDSESPTPKSLREKASALRIASDILGRTICRSWGDDDDKSEKAVHESVARLHAYERALLDAADDMEHARTRDPEED